MIWREKMTFVEIFNKDELMDGKMKMVDIDGREILVVRVGDDYYATDNRCPHMGGNLSLGKLDGLVITCPRHHSQFDIKDGHVIRWTDWTGIKLSLGKILKSPRNLQTYDVTLDGEKIMVDLV
jgi:3-phenylpropionate/trans-cinnamate dioxygenase ferredoxin subunit